MVRGVGGLPLSEAQVRVIGAQATAVSDARGRYALGDLPSGTQVLEVRRLGYLLAKQPVELRGGFGTFLAAEDIERRRPFQTSDLFWYLPGFKVTGFNYREGQPAPVQCGNCGVIVMWSKR